MPLGSVGLQPLQGNATACETASPATSGDGRAAETGKQETEPGIQKSDTPKGNKSPAC